MNFKVIHRLPTTVEYNELRAIWGWPAYESHIVEEALKNTLFSVCVQLEEKFIAMGRIVGDDTIYLHVQDVIVHPDFQRQVRGNASYRLC